MSLYPLNYAEYDYNSCVCFLTSGSQGNFVDAYRILSCHRDGFVQSFAKTVHSYKQMRSNPRALSRKT